jgi:TP901-1 family phage major tail protein
MAAQSGSDFLLKMGDGGGPEAFTVVGGFRSNSFNINNETIDITNKGSAGVRELMPGQGIQSFSASGSGVFVDDVQFGLTHTAVQNKTADNWQVEIPDFGTWEGPFMITSLEVGGEHNGEMTYSISLESAGALTFTTI